jgi:nucleotide-binding universal stress UspA family protein
VPTKERAADRTWRRGEGAPYDPIVDQRCEERKTSVSTRRDELLVAVADEASFAALDWAVGRALGSGRNLHLVHVAHSRHVWPRQTHPTSDLDAAESIGRRLVRVAAQRVEKQSGAALRVRTSVLTGRPADVLAEMASACAAVVLQHRPHSAAASVFGGSVAASVVARADVPVVLVPQAWETPLASGDAGLASRVTVGVAEPTAADALIGHAIDTCRGRECVVTLLHAWHVSAVHELGLNSQDFAVEWVEREAKKLNDVAAVWQSKTPNVLVEGRLLHGRPNSVLQEVARDSEHLVVGRSHAHPRGHVGSVTASLLRHAACPVEVLPTCAAAPA